MAVAPRYRFEQSSDTGHARKNNEDLVYGDEERGFFVVIDGMGGQAAGEEASRIALDRIRKRLERQTDSVEQRVREAIALANNAIFEASQKRDAWRGMGCVLTVAVIENRQVTIGHVGDSRLYKLRRGADGQLELKKLTHDHSPVGEREDSGEISEEEAMNHPRRNEVYRDVGSQPRDPHDEFFIEIVETPFEPESALLLCTDGLTDVVPSHEIKRIVEENVGDRSLTVRRLIEAANENSKDNVSIVFVEGERFAESMGLGGSRKRRARIQDPDMPTGQWASRVEEPRPWYRKSGALIAIGLLLGSALSVLLLQVAHLVWPSAPVQTGPREIVIGPDSPHSIAAALESAKPGDRVVLRPGEYREPIRLKDGIDVVAQTARTAAILPPQSGEPLPGAIADRGQHCRVIGLVVKGFPIGVSVSADSDIELDRVEVSGAETAAVEFRGASRGKLSRGYIHNNTGVGVWVRDNAALAMENNIFTANGVARTLPQPTIRITSSTPSALNGNRIDESGTPEAIWQSYPVDEPMLAANTIHGARGAKRHVRVLRLENRP
jgi:PPM family protein phosphatase